MHELPDRLDAVLTVVHLLYTTGHTAREGERLVRPELVERALGLARMLSSLMPDDREVRGLLALLLLNDARRETRAGPGGRLLLLEEQDRSRWDGQAIAEGTELVRQALRRGRPGRFALQAAIAAVHAEAPTYADTDWHEILGLYNALLAVCRSPVVELNRAELPGPPPRGGHGGPGASRLQLRSACRGRTPLPRGGRRARLWVGGWRTAWPARHRP